MNKYIEKTAIGIVTCNRPELLQTLMESLHESVGKIYVFNAGTVPIQHHPLMFWTNKTSNTSNIPVAQAKNILIRKMREMETNTYLFVLEDDIKILDNSVFEKYIDTATKTGLWGCLSCGGTVENPIETVNYSEDISIDLYRNSRATFALYHRNIFREIGFFDERFVNAAEHLDHYVEQYVKGIAPPFWYFPDIHESWKYIEDTDPNLLKSVIRNDVGFSEVVKRGWALFKQKRQMYPTEIPVLNKNEVLKVLEKIETNYGKK